MTLVRDRGVVLRTWPLGEADRIVAFMTEEHGKVRAVAKGVRKGTSRWSGLIQPSAVVDLLLWQARDLDTVSQVSLIEGNLGNRASLEQFSQIVELLEVVDRLSMDRQANPALYQLLLRGMRLMMTEPSSFLLGSLMIRVLDIEGYAPCVSRCGRCGATDDLVAFDRSTMCARCSGCGGERVDYRSLQLVQAILDGRTRWVLGVNDLEQAKRFEAFVRGLMTEVVGRTLRSVTIGAQLVAHHSDGSWEPRR
ncbi:MAG: DNA repair protein RecO [Ferrimicrobium sp.]